MLAVATLGTLQKRRRQTRLLLLTWVTDYTETSTPVWHHYLGLPPPPPPPTILPPPSFPLLPKQCMNLSKGKMLHHLANAYFIVCKTTYSLAFGCSPTPPPSSPSMDPCWLALLQGHRLFSFSSTKYYLALLIRCSSSDHWMCCHCRSI